MSVQTLYTAATGMQALETKLDVIANNLANVNTTGFKRDRATFEPLAYQNITSPGAPSSEANKYAAGVWRRGTVTRGQRAFLATFHDWRRGAATLAAVAGRLPGLVRDTRPATDPSDPSPGT